jgi:hypothetical protein
VQLYAAAGTLSMPDYIRVRARYYRTTMDSLRSLLAQDEISTLQSLGQKMSTEEAIQFALPLCKDSMSDVSST